MVLVLSFNCHAQFVITGIKDGVKYIMPCVENFARLSTLSESAFASIMMDYHYSEGESSAQWYSYTASIDNYLVHAVSNYDYAYGGKSVICWIPKSEMYPETAVQDIYRKLRPYFLKRDDAGDLFAFNYDGKAFGCIISNREKIYIIRTNYFGSADGRLGSLK